MNAWFVWIFLKIMAVNAVQRYTGSVFFASVEQPVSSESALWRKVVLQYGSTWSHYSHMCRITIQMSPLCNPSVTLHALNTKRNFFFLHRNKKKIGFKPGTWNFFETRHGEGSPDEVGGREKLTGLGSHGTDNLDAAALLSILKHSVKVALCGSWSNWNASQRNARRHPCCTIHHADAPVGPSCPWQYQILRHVLYTGQSGL